MNGDRRKERYGVMSDCYSQSARDLARGRCRGWGLYLEVIQETHVGITERDLPLRRRIRD